MNNTIFKQIRSNILIRLITGSIALSVCNSHANKFNPIDPKCSDTTSYANENDIDSSRFGFIGNDPRILLSGKKSMYRKSVDIQYVKNNPDICVNYGLFAKSFNINNATICFKYNKNHNELRDVHRLGLGSSGPPKEFDVSTISFVTEKTDSSLEIEIQYGVSFKDTLETVEVVLQFDSNGVKTLSRIPPQYTEKIHFIDCKKSLKKCVNTYDF